MGSLSWAAEVSYECHLCPLPAGPYYTVVFTVTGRDELCLPLGLLFLIFLWRLWSGRQVQPHCHPWEHPPSFLGPLQHFAGAGCPPPGPHQLLLPAACPTGRLYARTTPKQNKSPREATHKGINHHSSPRGMPPARVAIRWRQHKVKKTQSEAAVDQGSREFMGTLKTREPVGIRPLCPRRCKSRQPQGPVQRTGSYADKNLS